MLYDGVQHVDALGQERYVLPPDEVSKLVSSAVSKNLMSLKGSYHSGATDLPTNTVRLTLGGRTHQIVDYAGQAVGMPAVVTQFEQEIDDVLARAVRQRLSPPGLAQLAGAGFRFDTPAGIALLERAARASSNSDDKSRLAIFERLAPAGMSGKQVAQAGELQQTMVVSAIAQGHAALLTQMLSRGALRTAGNYDQVKLDHAFFTAVSSSRPALVEMLWQLPDKAPRPALLYEDPWATGKGVRRVPLTLLLGFDASKPKDGNDFAIAKFLVAKGCDPRATGGRDRTLLHIATASNDVEFVRYVLGLGVDPSMPGQFGFPAVASARDEDVALALLEAGMSRKSVNKLAGFREYCEKKQWHRVLAWLKAS